MRQLDLRGGRWHEGWLGEVWCWGLDYRLCPVRCEFVMKGFQICLYKWFLPAQVAKLNGMVLKPGCHTCFAIFMGFAVKCDRPQWLQSDC